MNTKRIIFWASFIVVLGLIIWGLIVAMNKPVNTGPKLGTPPEVTTNDHVLGVAEAPVTLIEYSDFQCPACAAMHTIVDKLINEASSTIRFVYRHFPLFPLPHKNAFLAAQAGESASLQGKFWEMYSILFENQTAWGNSDTASAIFEGYAEQIGLNMVSYKKDFNSNDVKARIEKDRNEGEALGISGTPTFFVNGKAINNPPNYEAFKALIETAARKTAQ